MPKIPESKDGAVGPSGRLALGADIVKTIGDKALGSHGPTVRLATPLKSQIGANSADHLASIMPAPASVRLAHIPGAQGDNLLGRCGVAQLEGESKPALLVSYVYLEPFLANKHRYAYRDWVLDSGAFSAHNSGEVIVLQDYIDCCKRLLAEDPTLTEVFALDVIGDYKASLRNAEEMWRQGIPAIPTFHYGSPWDSLKGIAKDYPKIALGGSVGKRDKDKFAGQCFARVWPKRVHGFGFGSEKSIMMFPFHSTDATNWELAVCKFGHWKAFGGQRVSVRGSKQNLRAEVEWYLDLERRARERWKKEMEKLETIGPTPALALDASKRERAEQKMQAMLGPAGRLVPNAKPGREDAKENALGPSLRLAHGGNATAASNRGQITRMKSFGKKE